jgi:hypothetical protein
VRIAALWVLAGALFKLFQGTPSDLPSVVRELPLDLGLTYRLAISVELGVVVLALFAPRIGWPLVAGLMAVFSAILVALVLRGDANCGCFGSSVTFPPLLMLGIDAGLLAGILATRPWRRTATQRRIAPALVALPLLAGVAAPWVLDREASAQTSAESERKPLPQYAILTPSEWVGMPVEETDLARWLGPGVLPEEDGLVLIYRMTCELCAEHLFEVAAMDDGSRPIVLVRIVDENEDPAKFVVEVVPEGPHVRSATLPRGVDWVMTTPAELEIEDGVVVAASEGV